MNGPGKELLAGSAWPLNEHRAGALRDLWKDVEQPRHCRTSTDDILEGIFAVQFLFQLFDGTQVLKSLHSPNYLSRIISKNGRRNSDRDAFACLRKDMGSGVEYRLAVRHRASQKAGIFTNVRSKDVTALPAQGFAAAYLCDLLRSPVEGRNAPLQIDGENTLVDRIQYGFFSAGQIHGHLKLHALLHFARPLYTHACSLQYPESRSMKRKAEEAGPSGSAQKKLR